MFEDNVRGLKITFMFISPNVFIIDLGSIAGWFASIDESMG